MIEFPEPGSKDAITIHIDQSLDFSLLSSALSIADNDNKSIAGIWSIGNEEKSIRFTPEANWAAGQYFLLVETRLEDLAGNNINRPFDLDTKNNKEAIGKDEVVSIGFDIR
jgi:hypothetical protein